MEKQNKGGCFVGVGFIILFIIFLFMGYSEKSAEEYKKNPPPPSRVTALVKTERFTLTPGQRIVFNTKDPETGELCRVVPVWEQFTDSSMLYHSIHGELGEDGVGSHISDSYLHPKYSPGFHRGDDKTPTAHYVCVENRRDSTVSFTVKFWGLRVPGQM